MTSLHSEKRWRVTDELAALSRALNRGGSGSDVRRAVERNSARGGWGASRPRVYVPGSQVGAWSLVRAVAPVGANSRWLARCSCGRLEVIYPAQVSGRGGPGTCRECYSARVKNDRPYLCLTCGKVGPHGFRVGKVKSSCVACSRAAARNGRHSCGRAIRHQQPPPNAVRPCACGDPAPSPAATTKRSKTKRAPVEGRSSPSRRPGVRSVS